MAETNDGAVPGDPVDLTRKFEEQERPRHQGGGSSQWSRHRETRLGKEAPAGWRDKI